MYKSAIEGLLELQLTNSMIIYLKYVLNSYFYLASLKTQIYHNLNNKMFDKYFMLDIFLSISMKLNIMYYVFLILCILMNVIRK